MKLQMCFFVSGPRTIIADKICIYTSKSPMYTYIHTYIHLHTYAYTLNFSFLPFTFRFTFCISPSAYWPLASLVEGFGWFRTSVAFICRDVIWTTTNQNLDQRILRSLEALSIYGFRTYFRSHSERSAKSTMTEGNRRTPLIWGVGSWKSLRRDVSISRNSRIEVWTYRGERGMIKNEIGPVTPVTHGKAVSIQTAMMNTEMVVMGFCSEREIWLISKYSMGKWGVTAKEQGED